MKTLFPIFFLIFLSVDTFSQDTTAAVIYINKIPTEGVLLDKGWKFHAGDNPDYAKPDFDDSKWQCINPTLDIHDSLPQIPRSGICWFRLHLSLDSELLKNQFALIIEQSGASEIYLNGRLLHRFGIVSTNLREITAFDPLGEPLLFPIGKNAHEVLAIALQSGIFYTTILETGNPAISIKVIGSDRAFNYHYQKTEVLQQCIFFYIGLLIMIIILHVSFYLLYPSQKANLYFALFAILYVTGLILQLNFFFYNHAVVKKFYIGNIIFLLFILSNLYILLALQYFLERKKDIFFWTLIMLTGIAIVLNMWPYGWGWRIGGPIVQVLIYINITRIAFISAIKKKRGAWILAIGSACSLLSFVAFLLQGTFSNTSFVQNLPYLRIVTAGIQILTIPAATSVFLALDFAYTNRSLQQKLAEIEKLSEDNLKKETEKNTLALQMATLETKALRSQMNPHFIFNALNAIKKFLLKNDTANADKYLSSFAKLQRLVLDNTRESKVVLENEIKLLELYLRLEHLRFEDRLSYSIHVDEKINPTETEIPSMLIQPFVENSIVHGLQHKTGMGEIRILFCQKDGWIETIIEDNGIGREHAAAFQKNEAIPHKSLATKISEERLLALRKSKNIPAGINIIDLYDEEKRACGTRVIICIPLE